MFLLITCNMNYNNITIGQYKTWTAEYDLRTEYKTDSGIKRGLNITDWVLKLIRTQV